MSEEFEKLEEMEQERTLSYERFEQYGKEFIDVLDDGIEGLEGPWVSAQEILEASDEDKSSFEEKEENRKFVSIYNLMCHLDFLPAFHDSQPYEISTAKYEKQPVIDAWEHVSRESYEDSEGPEKLYNNLKD